MRLHVYLIEWNALQDLVRVKYLCEASGMKAVGIVDGKSHTPLHWAALNNAMRVAKYLLENGSDVHVSTSVLPHPEAVRETSPVIGEGSRLWAMPFALGCPAWACQYGATSHPRRVTSRRA